jgi:hypothetical protein
MMSGMVQPRRSWLLCLVAGVVAVAGLAVWLSRPDAQGARAVSTQSSREGWQRLEYGDVRVDVPQDWTLQDSDECRGRVEHWGPPTTATCGERPGVSFLGSSTFDAGTEPRTVTSSREAGVRSWSGYVILRDVVVHATGGDRAVVAEVLGSASAPGFQPIE